MLATARSGLSFAEVPEQRAALERFIAERFRLVHGACISHFCAHLLGMRDALGRWQAGAGYTAAASGKLFLEQYLDRPVEELLAGVAGQRVARERVAEVGNLAAAAPGMVRTLIPAIGRHLHHLGYRWVVFTATRELRNAFRRLHLEPLQLAPALPARLPDAGVAWGSYYAHDPAIMGGRLAYCLEKR
jgi:hypothetical protein